VNDQSREGAQHAQSAFERVDSAVDAAFEPLRGREPVDRAATALSNLSDYGLIWVLLALVKMRRKGPRRRRAVVALGAAGFSSLIVSRLAKNAIERERPDEHLSAHVRTPTSSSFPSGHTLAAFTTAVVLPETDSGRAVAVGFASAVAASRVHLRAHHPTDVIGGAVIGSALGLVLRPLVNTLTPGTRRRGKSKVRRSEGMDPGDYLLTRL
jgi:membrane-associated phospholipid phosphatase